MAEPLFGLDGLHLTQLKTSIDVGTYLRVTHLVSTFARLLNWRRNQDNTVEGYFRFYSCVGNTISPTEDVPPQWAPVGSVVDLVFAVHACNNEEYTWLGRLDTYFIDKLTATHEHEFPCDSPLFPRHRSYAKLIWLELQRIRLAFRKILGSSSLAQGRFDIRKQETAISVDTFAYIKRQVLHENGAALGEGFLKSIDYELYAGLTCGSKRRRYVSETLKFIGSDGVKLLTSLFGNYSVFGIRMRRPRIDAPRRPLRSNDTVHYIVENEEVSSCVLSYASDSGYMKITLSYSPFVANWNPNSEVINAPTQRLKATIERRMQANNEQQDEQQDAHLQGLVQLGDSFEYDHQLFDVTSIDGESCVCTSVSGIHRICELQINIAADLIEAYLE